MKKYEIKNIFFIKDRELIIIHLKEFDWNFKKYGVVYLCYDEQRIKMDYTGFGNHEGNPTLSLKLHDSRFNSINEIESEIKSYKGNYFLER
jgi:hypothetical protein